MSKQISCTKCLELKDFSDFYKDKSKKRGINTRCKSCDNEYKTSLYKKGLFKGSNKKYRKSLKHKPTVYLLPNENYVGTTECIVNRIAWHKCKNRDVSNLKILAEFDNRAVALELEEFLHDLGYFGKHKHNTYK